MTLHICSATIERDQARVQLTHAEQLCQALRAQRDALALAINPSRSVTEMAALIALAQAHYQDSQDVDRLIEHAAQAEAIPAHVKTTKGGLVIP